jgi:plastocyanin
VKTGQNVTIDLIAENITFNLTTITVPAGAQVTINFTNRDPGIPHNLDIFQTGGQYNRGIFTGHSITGISTITYQFTAPTTSGNYKFVCDFHPLQMYGSFVVTQP